MSNQPSPKVVHVTELEPIEVVVHPGNPFYRPSQGDLSLAQQQEPNSQTIVVRTLRLTLGDVHIELLSLGATISKFMVPHDGTSNDGRTDVVLGYPTITDMVESGNSAYFGCIVGRVANRIAHGKFSLGEDTYLLECNNGPNHLHGGSGGFSHQNWQSTRIDNGVEFALTSPHMDQGYPGTIHVTARYTLMATSITPTTTKSSSSSSSSSCSYSQHGVVLRLEMAAKLQTSEGNFHGMATPINLAQHSYFNLAGQDNPKGILEHTLTLHANAYTPVDDTSIPTREVRSLQDDPVMDWRTPRALHEALVSYGVRKLGLTNEQATRNLTQHDQHHPRKLPIQPYGFDHNYVIRPNTCDTSSDDKNGSNPVLSKVACLQYDRRRLTVYSNTPGVQLYTANYLDPNHTKRCKVPYGPWQGLCLETQHFPDSISMDPLPLDEEQNQHLFWKGKCFLLQPNGPDYSHIVEYHYQEDDDDNDKIGDSQQKDATVTMTGGMFVGSDTEGNQYTSIDEMWSVQDLSTWYHRASEYYEENCSTTIDGVLGGIGWISDIDLQGSRAFLSTLNLPALQHHPNSLACECGAGIGRVTKGVLLDFCERCDLVESSSRLLSAAPDYIGERSGRCRFFCSGLQDWTPPCSSSSNGYTIIWIQWVLCYLTDEDIVSFLQRCAKGLVDGGVIVLKENTCTDELFVLDVDDASVTRSLSYWLSSIEKAGLQVIKTTWQEGFPDDIYPVPMLALQPKVS